MTGLPGRITLDGDPLDPIGGGDRIGYARMSTRDQNLRRQVDALTEARCHRVFEEKLSGRTAERPELWNCLEFLRAGDTLVVLELSRLGRSLQDLIALVGGLRKRGIGFTSLHENLDTTTPGGRLVFHVFAALGVQVRPHPVADEGGDAGCEGQGSAARQEAQAQPASGSPPGRLDGRC